MKANLLLAASLLTGAVGAAPIDIQLWRHETGDSDMRASAAAEARFNSRQSRYRVLTETLPQGSYQQSVIAAAMTKKLPCVLDLDQPSVPNFAWAGHIQPLEGALRPAGAEALIPGGRSTFKGKLYAVGQFDAALALFARKSLLAKHGVRLATMAHPYTAAEFRDILRDLKRAGFSYPLDLNAQWTGEWVSYAFSPWLQSAGADLIDRKTFTQVDGLLNGDAALGVVDFYRSLFTERLVARRPVDDQSFPRGRAAFHYTGSWAAKDYLMRLGDDLVVMPPPAFGPQPRIGAGSWQWAVSSSCPHPEGARLFLEHLTSAAEIAAFSEATGLMPTSEAAANATTLYRPGAFGRDLFEFARAYGVLRPETPAYPMLSSSFERALKEVREGGDAAEALDRAVEAIQQDLRRNHNYGF
ncbi:MAG TPA: extracellular solute-binding protein [Ideonella sp.]|uniref:sugar ABC transporter substrate-binding protein n=1 Tax=Ideonella sp. TaxID=1929293 RepID=UPI002BA99DAD|nr:extracellular solute-binding protein [Ideonella sp.]HSI47938.1 extracellular solute-binding protein [Ideonella sp.]